MSHIVITGASSGIGAAVARALATPHTRITLVARRRQALEQLAAELPGQVQVTTRDLSDPDPSWLDAVCATFGPVDVLVNNAGMQVLGKTHEVDMVQASTSLALNLATPLQLIHTVLPSMLERGGTIVNIASLAALAPPPGMAWYNASKAGLAAASESLQGELLNSNVHVLTVYPGVIHDTAMGEEGVDAYGDSWAVRYQPSATAAQLARQIQRSMERKRPRLVYPRVNAITRWFPAPTRWLIDRFTPAI